MKMNSAFGPILAFTLLVSATGARADLIRGQHLRSFEGGSTGHGSVDPFAAIGPIQNDIRRADTPSCNERHLRGIPTKTVDLTHLPDGIASGYVTDNAFFLEGSFILNVASEDPYADVACALAFLGGSYLTYEECASYIGCIGL